MVYNNGFAKKRVQWLIEYPSSYQHLCWVDSSASKSATAPSPKPLAANLFDLTIESIGVYAVKDTTYILVEDWASESRNERCIIFRLRIKDKQVLGKDSILSGQGLLARYKRSALPK